MGHQQFFLMVLGVVIIGLAIVAGLDAFDRNRKKANLDALVNDGLRLAGRAQRWKAEAPLYGGGANKSWSDLTWNDIGYTSPPEDGRHKTQNGYFELSVTDDGYLQLVGKNEQQANKVTITVQGLGSDRIVTIIQNL